ncbi:MAG: YjjG family noncanonical pyrimidine nucleotidase [Eubacteriales bacterium]|nr:YjjG family noncanonical pyrimidine nucleotidase [Eubacteriales bacterium]
MKRIKVVLWDIDGTLLNFKEAEKYAIRACFERFGLGECTDQMLREYSAINSRYWRGLECGEYTKPQVLVGRFEEFFEKYGIDTSIASSFNDEYQIRLGDTVCFCENGLETVRALKGKVLQYAVTNGTKAAQDRKLANSGLDQLLDGIFISEEIGIEKPMTGFFDKVFREIGVYRKDEMMIVGDSLTSDMQGGNNVGIVTCWYHPEGKENYGNLRIDYEIHDIKQVLEIV